MQNNTIAFTILKFPVLVRVQHNFTTVYSIFLRSPPKLGADILLFSLLRLSLLPPFNWLYFSKGTYVARLASWQIPTFSLVHFLRSKEPSAPHRKSLVFKSRIYHRCPLRQRYSEGQGHRASFVSSTLTIAITFIRGIRLNGRAAAAESSDRRRRSEGLSGPGPIWLEQSSIFWPGFVGSNGRFPSPSRGNCRWVWVVVRGG